MKMPYIQADNEQHTAGTPPQRLPLDSVKSATRSFSRLIAAYYRGTLDERKFKMMTYSLNVLLGYLKEAEAEELERRIAALEARVQTKKEKTHG